jgi:hypothetical protein
MSIRGSSEKIRSSVLSWPGVVSYPHRFGGTEYRLGKREIGHVHGDSLVDVPFPKKVRDELVAEGRAEPHHVLPKSGWVSFYIQEEDDVEKAIELLRFSFDLASQRLSKQSEAKWGSKDSEIVQETAKEGNE